MMNAEDRQMREIEFRGKKINFMSSEWVFGYYDGSDSCDQIIDSTGEFHKVLPATLGQYTGLKDKKGNKVFEGDVVEFKSEFDYKHRGVVKWQCSGGYMIWNELEQGAWIWDGTISKVIGNVFDDSKLNDKYGKIWSEEIVIKCRS